MPERPSAPPDPPPSDGTVALRSWGEADLPALLRACNGDEDLAYWLDFLPQPYTEDSARQYLAANDAGWRGDRLETPLAIADAADGAALGSVALFWHEPEQGVAEIGYWVGRDARGRGVATRALRLAAAWVLGDLAFERLELRADPRNEPSTRVAEKAGFTFEGVLRSAHTNARDGRRVDYAVYSLLRAEL